MTPMPPVPMYRTTVAYVHVDRIIPSIQELNHEGFNLRCIEKMEDGRYRLDAVQRVFQERVRTPKDDDVAPFYAHNLPDILAYSQSLGHKAWALRKLDNGLFSIESIDEEVFAFVDAQRDYINSTHRGL